jgi:MoaA/NifB/PqqE/SkfB family radical SAM enzyme
MFNSIKWLHVEPSTRCNAWCSSCGRNKSGFGLTDFVIEDLKAERLKEVIDQLPSLETVQFCGNLGDPCASKIIDQQLKIVKDKDLNLQLHTNGSLRTVEWWVELAKTFREKIEVWFAIDGMKDTHSIYRQGTNWQKIIDNASAFIEAGGQAIWQFIPFAHNEHQIKDCMRLATKLGFHRFEFVKNARYREKHFHYKTGKPLDIKAWSQHESQWHRRGGILDKVQKKIVKNIVLKKDCMHLALPSIFLNANGVISPCCYFGNIPLSENNIDQQITQKKYNKICLKKCGSTHN